MSFFELLFKFDINIVNLSLRLLLSFIIGGIIGFEREQHKQPAGLRTHILICVGSCLLMILSIYMTQLSESKIGIDPARIAAQVVSGIGFLGAGAILRLGLNVKGVTTAATIWVIAAVGLSVGAGMYVGAIISAILILFTLIGIDAFERKFFQDKSLRMLEIKMNTNQLNMDQLYSVGNKYGITIKSVDIEQSFEKKTVNIKLIVQLPEYLDYKQFYNEFGLMNGVSKVTLKQSI